MASSILSSLLSKPKFTISSSGRIFMRSAKIKRVQIQLSSHVARHMREDGTSIVDNRVIRPTIVIIEMIAPSVDDVEDAIGVMNDRENLYTISTKGLVFDNMMSMTAATKQTADMLSSAPFQVVFKELLQENVSPVVCAQGGDSDTKDSGIQILGDISGAVGGLVSTVTNNFNNSVGAIKNIFGG